MTARRAADPRPPPDLLGEALHFLRMDGTFQRRSELSAPWGITLGLRRPVHRPVNEPAIHYVTRQKV